MRLTRVYRFSASHRLHSKELSAEQNAEMYGKCNNPFGHGHNYVLHVSVRGEIQNSSGRILDIGALDRYVQEQVITAFDHKDLNADTPDFLNVVPTTENLAVAIKRRLRESWHGRFGTAQLDRIHIEETARNRFELRSYEKS
jgi:6-pyruvoyltetrahydropterin/6-carboxytetrahydropterin synthase